MPNLNRKEIKLFLTFFIVYGISVSFFEANEISIVDGSLALGYYSKFAVDDLLGTGQLKTLDLAYNAGHYFALKAPGLPLIEYPILRLAKFFCQAPTGAAFWVLIFVMTVLTSTLCASLTCVLVYKISAYFTKEEKCRLMLVFFYGFGSVAFYYATSIKTHSTSTFLAFLCFYLVFEFRQQKKAKYENVLLSGIFGGISFLTEYQTIFVVIICIVLLLQTKKTKSAIFFLCGLLPFVLILLLYNSEVSGNALSLNYSYYDINVFSAGTYVKLYDFFRFGNDNIVLTLLLRFVDKSARILFFPYRGIFVYTPFLFVSFLGIYYMQKRFRFEAICILTLFILFFVFFAFGIKGWWGSTGYGNRYFLVMIPFLMLPAACIIDKISFRLLLCLLLISIFLNVLSTQRIEWIAYSYGPITSYMVYNDLCYLREMENPITTYYLPLFLKFGPQSYVIGRIFGLKQDNWLGIHTEVIPFSNLILVSFVVLLIWRKDILRFVYRRKVALTLVILLVFSFLVLRIVLDKEVTGYVRGRLHSFYEDKQCEDNVLSNMLKPLYEHKERKYVEKWEEFYGYRWLIPYSLWVDDNLPVAVGTNRGWKRPDVLLTKIHWSYANATITLYNNLSRDLPITLNFAVEAKPVPKPSKFFEVYFNDEETASLEAKRGIFATYSLDLDLKPGWNAIRFNGQELCDEILLCGDLIFRKIQIVNRNKNDLLYYGKNWIEDEQRYLERPKIFMTDDGEIVINSTMDSRKNFTFRLYSNQINRTLELYQNDKLKGRFFVDNDFYYQNTINMFLNISKGMNVIRFHNSEACSNYRTPENRTYCVSFIATIDYNRVISFY